jgi:hypothetical protein
MLCWVGDGEWSRLDSKPDRCDTGTPGLNQVLMVRKVFMHV